MFFFLVATYEYTTHKTISTIIIKKTFVAICQHWQCFGNKFLFLFKKTIVLHAAELQMDGSLDNVI